MTALIIRSVADLLIKKTACWFFPATVLVFVMGAVGISTYNDWGGDYALYLDQAKVIINGDLPEFVSDVRFRVGHGGFEGPAYYPWGFPALIAPIYWLTSGDHGAIKLFSLLLLIGSSWLTFSIIGKEGAGWKAALGALLFLSSGYIYGLTDLIISDFAGLFFSLLVIYTYSKWNVAQRRHVWVTAPLLLGIITAFASIVRTQNLAVALIVGVWLASDAVRMRESRMKLIGAMVMYYVSLLIALMIYNMADPMEIDGSYFKYFSLSSLIDTASLNIPLYVKALRVFYSVDSINWLRSLLAIPLTLFMIVGMLKSTGWISKLALYIAVVYAMLIVYPFYQHLRLAIPVLPFMAFFVVEGGIVVDHWLRRQYANIYKYNIAFGLVLSAIVLMTIGNGVTLINKIGAPIADGPYSEYAIAAFEAVKLNVPEDEAVLFFKPRILTYETGRRSVYDESRRNAKLHGVRYGLYCSEQLNKGWKTFDVSSDSKVIFRNERYVLYQL